ncbi:MAG: chromosomal replication initiator protein DnaA [Bacteroidales bacterium]|jgi:chromosomal replication initiator protein|nr:chromosomal replication initiator protein DnaA [Bacteroidales bacterium]
MRNDCINLWKDCLSVIKDNVPEATFTTWFSPIVPLSFTNDILVVQVPSQFFYEYLEEKFIDLIQKTLHRVIGPNTKLMYRIVVENTTHTTVDLDSIGKSAGYEKNKPKSNANKSPQILTEVDSQLRPNYNFDNFSEGISNRLARTAGLTVAESLGTSPFNPLFLYGQPGVGKTHLLHAIGNRIEELNPGKRVLYISAYLFLVQYTDAVRNNTVNDFINFYQHIDALLIDDIQQLAGKTGTQNTFFHIFNYLHQSRKQLVLSCDTQPVLVQGLEDRLLNRFICGLTAELNKPDLELRKKILKNKIRQEGAHFPEAVITYIAENVTESIRDLEGVIVSLAARSIIDDHEIDLELAQLVVSNTVKIKKKEITVEWIREVVCNHFSLDQQLFSTKSRKREIVQARQIAMYLVRKYTAFSSSKIGELLGKKDHATVLHALKTVRDLMDIDLSFRNNVNRIEEKLQV